MHPQHRFLQNPLFTSFGLRQRLLRKVKTGYTSSTLTANGIPPHVNFMSALKEMMNGTEKTIECVERSREGVVNDIFSELEQRAIG
jgi:SUMO ligase MMS21 Smc5/6 complex component